jgi:hypothetical protein
MTTLSEQSVRVLRQRVTRKIEVNYIPSEVKANYGYHWSGVPNRGFNKFLYGKWAIAPTWGKQFDPFGRLEDL